MISLALARRSDRLMKAATSLTVPEFGALARQFAPLWSGTLAAHTAAGAPRHRRPGGGRKSLLPTPELKLFFILFYYKAYPTQDVMGTALWPHPGTNQRLGPPAHRPGGPVADLAQARP